MQHPPAEGPSCRKATHDPPHPCWRTPPHHSAQRVAPQKPHPNPHGRHTDRSATAPTRAGLQPPLADVQYQGHRRRDARGRARRGLPGPGAVHLNAAKPGRSEPGHPHQPEPAALRNLVSSPPAATADRAAAHQLPPKCG